MLKPAILLAASSSDKFLITFGPILTLKPATGSYSDCSNTASSAYTAYAF